LSDVSEAGWILDEIAVKDFNCRVVASERRNREFAGYSIGAYKALYHTSKPDSVPGKNAVAPGYLSTATNFTRVAQMIMPTRVSHFFILATLLL
jgi:hypothetical protein